jgi:hypothetical protein
LWAAFAVYHLNRILVFGDDFSFSNPADSMTN